ncbi:MAG: T9SS type A sorting domain-containing protein [Crocinitomicaceae bacterium]|nr:T9SS type A sorting domain-containing protein [Flavobacteriales bacterium]NQZ37181.1 T9SS type A sorting domain-containing protein [Crocinitomicaceae bacterium]
MKKTTILFTIFMLFAAFMGSAQVFIPKQLQGNSPDTNVIKLSEIYDNYMDLKSSTDTLLNHDKKIVDRWMYNEMSRINVRNDSTYNFSDYSKAFKLFVENGPFCNEDDISDWENIGPRNVGHRNGWVSAVHYNPDPDPTKEYHLLGARTAGIFRSQNGGVNWECVTDNLDYPVLGVRQLEPSPMDGQYLIAVTGTESGVDVVQNNLLISSDGGVQWSAGTNILQTSTGSIPLKQISVLKFHKTIPGLVVALTRNQIIISQDNGLTWRELDAPSDFVNVNSFLTDLAISVNKVHIVLNQENSLDAYYWSGDLTLNTGSGIYTINWSLDRSGELHTDPVFLVSDDTPYYLDVPMNQNNLGQSSPNWYQHHLPAAYGCNPNYAPLVNQNVGGWNFIHTPGWSEIQDGGVNKLSCTYSGQSINLREVTTEKVSVSIWLWNQPAFSGEGEINCVVPKGARLKICVSSIRNNINGLSGNPWTLCSYALYDDVIFDNEIYLSPWATTSDLLVEDIFSFNPYDYFLRSPSTLDQAGSFDQTLLVYYVLEYDDNISGYDIGEFKLNKFDLRVANNSAPHTIVFSSTEDDRFYVASIGMSYSNIYRTLNNGNSYLRLNGASAIVGFGHNKHLFLASPNNPFTYYLGATYQQILRSDGNFAGNQTHTLLSCTDNVDSHKDFRSGKIFNQDSRDYIVAGNDGGICEVTSANTNAQTNSINGDIVLNMIYNLDVHEKDKIILIGLQDNGTRYFHEGVDGAVNVEPGDGSIAMIQTSSVPLDDSYGFIVGDPQDANSGALKDRLIGVSAPNGIVDNGVIINEGDAYLGMRLEEYKHFEDQFITGLQGSSPGAEVIMNRGVNDTEGVVVDEAQKLGSIGICQNHPSTVYIADGAHRAEGKFKLYKTTDDGYNWDEVDAELHVPNHPGTPLNLIEDVGYKFINALGVDHDDYSLVYIGMSGIGEINGVVTNEYFRVLRSFDGGLNFDDWSQGLPALPVNYLLPIESENHIIFCATDAGVYYRMDDMSQWECFSNHLAKTRITDLSYNYCSRELYASTYGRGVWKTPVNLETRSTYSEDIIGNEVWDVDRDVRSNIRVKTGSTLTITATIHIDADRKFIIEPGAKLIIDNGTLTNACAQYWTGIEVWGNESLSQDPQNQGHLITRNNSKIEYAKEAISTWKRGEYGTTGGIVHVQNTDFVNNRTSAYFYPYHDINNQSIETLNVGFISDCRFIWNNSYIDESPEAGVIMYHVNGVTISGCDFLDNRLILDQFNFRPKGIFSLDAGYKVIAGLNQTSQAVHEIFETTGGYDVNNFLNLEYGIHAMGANSASTITADHCKFQNVRHSISISAVDNAVLTRNLVDYTVGHPADITSSQGFGISESTGFTIEGNTFNNAEPSAFSGGVLAWDTGAEENEIRLNYYNDQNLANYAYGINSNTDPNTIQFPDELTGLLWLCNEGINNRFDLASFGLIGVDGQGVRLWQGNAQLSVGNKFTDLSYPSLSAHILHTDDDQMRHFVFNGDPQQDPTVLDGDIQVTLQDNENLCNSNFLDEIIVEESRLLSLSSESQISAEIIQIDQELQTKQIELETNLTNGDDQNLHSLVANLTPENKQTIRATLMAESPYLSQTLLEELGELSPGSYPHAWYAELIEVNIEITRSEEFMNFLQTKPVPLPNGLFNQIEALRNSSFTERGELEMTINRLAKKRKQKTNLLVANELSDSNKIDWNKVKYTIVQRDNKVCRAEVSDQFLGGGKTNECLAVLDAIDQNLADYDLAYEQQEMQDFTTFKRYVLNITNNTGVVEGLDNAQIQQLTSMADQFTGRGAIQARNILCFHEGMCEERTVVLPASGMQLMNTEEGNEVEGLIGVSGAELKVIPNPNSGEFVLEVPKECSIASLSIVDAQGRVVAFETIEQIENKKRIVVMNEETGILFLKAECTDGSVYTTRVLVNK